VVPSPAVAMLVEPEPEAVVEADAVATEDTTETADPPASEPIPGQTTVAGPEPLQPPDPIPAPVPLEPPAPIPPPQPLEPPDPVPPPEPLQPPDPIEPAATAPRKSTKPKGKRTRKAPAKPPVKKAPKPATEEVQPVEGAQPVEGVQPVEDAQPVQAAEPIEVPEVADLSEDAGTLDPEPEPAAAPEPAAEPEAEADPGLLPMGDRSGDDGVVVIRSRILRIWGRLIGMLIALGALGTAGYLGYQAWTEGGEGLPAVFVPESPTASPSPTEDFTETNPGYVTLVISQEDGSWAQPALVVNNDSQAVVRYDWVAEAQSLRVQYGPDDYTQARMIGYNKTWNVALLDVGIDPRTAAPPTPTNWVAQLEDSGQVQSVGTSPALGTISATEATIEPCFGRTKTVCGQKKLFGLVSILTEDAAGFTDPALDSSQRTVALIIGQSDDATRVYGLGEQQLGKVIEKILSEK
jgi:hypothetical protein